ncbi:lysosomal proton-coupled steroid conjugate and bile acid symporter SLC46A3-like [Mytilus galloprovincialis]|uniref:lysosomal proton-coupled steroid conjugate and bile acid symporter SLC46A3-like n=1 Tax=Mytilus galloprovincialis TaxID=29158 RepID=UPI003F7C23AF
MQSIVKEDQRNRMTSKVAYDRSEETPLLVNKDNCEDIKLRYPRWLTFSVLISIPFLHMLSYILSLYVIGQYTYVYFLEEKFPGVPHSLSGSLSSCNINKSSIAYFIESSIQQTSAKWAIYTNLAFIIPSVLININLATYSDVHGRKLFFIVPLAGTIIKNILCAVGMYYKMNVRLMLIFYMIEACTGSWVASLSMSFCFVADTTTPGKGRSLIISLLDGGVGLGAIGASFLSGYLITWTNGYHYPQFMAVIIAIIPFLCVLTMVQETLPISRRRSNVSILQNIQRVFDCYRSNFSPFGKRWVFVVLIITFAMSALTVLSRTSVDSLYFVSAPFCWSSITIGLYTGIRIVLWNIGGVILIIILQICTTDEVISLVGCITTTAALIIQGLAKTNFMMYIAALSSIGCIVTMPMIRGIMSKMTPPEKQGSIFAGVAAVESFSSLFGTVIIGIIYDSTVTIYRGLTFLIWAGIGGIGIILSLILIMEKRNRPAVNQTSRSNIVIKVDSLVTGE